MKVHLLVVPALAFVVAVVVAEYESPVPPPVPPPAGVSPPKPEEVVPLPPHPFVPYEVIEAHGEDDDDDAGFVVQNGFEGYIVPEDINLLQPGKTEGVTSLLPVLGLLGGLMKLPKLFLGLFPVFGNFLLLLLTGGAVATAVCAFTPFCTLPIPLRMDGIKSYVDSDRAKFGLGFILDAIEYYEKWYHKEDRMRKDETNQAKRIKKRR